MPFLTKSLKTYLKKDGAVTAKYIYITTTNAKALIQ